MSAAAIAFPERPERLYSLRELSEMGYGSRRTLQTRIHEGKVPAVLVNHAYKIRASDLHLLAEQVGCLATPVMTVDDLAELTAKVISTWPRLSDDRKAELSRLLAA
ncbi:hypothetical protein SB749_15100 [Brevibacterium sp. SIMBA_078]|uniref:hypothetical protein n=1 Tax=Brevibacterium sp. SIMBA_078 TaxID=3085816 RepID=UPI00397E511A